MASIQYWLNRHLSTKQLLIAIIERIKPKISTSEYDEIITSINNL